MRSYKYMYSATFWAMTFLSMRLADKIMPQPSAVASGLVAFTAIVSAIFIQISRSKKDFKQSTNSEGRARKLGMDAADNMTLCSGSFALLAILQFIFWGSVVLPGPLSPLVKVFTLNKFLSPLALAGLLHTMKIRFRDATIEATSTADSSTSGRQDIFHALRKAESGFYGKVSNVLISSSIVDILRWVILATISHKFSGR
eukprot:3007022-Ditylum_brightwellii.AAC.1